MGADDLQEDADTTAQQDIYYNKDANKLVVQDLEHIEMEKKKEKDLKRKRRDETGYGDKVDISDDSDDDMNSNRRQRSKKDGNNSGVALKDLGKL